MLHASRMGDRMRYRPAFLDLSPGLKDLQAGLTVAIVALPLSLAIAIASGVPPDRGLVTAIVGGFLVSALGGTRHQIGGPAGAFIVLVAACVSAIGIEGLILATCLSGIMLAALGALRLGGAIRFVPYPVILGFTAGIAVIIAASQLGDLLGIRGAGHGGLPQMLAGLWAARAQFQPGALALAVLTVATIWASQRFAPRLPSLLMGVGAATLAAQFIPAETILDRFGALPAGLPLPQLPQITLDAVMAALPFAIGFALRGPSNRFFRRWWQTRCRAAGCGPMTNCWGRGWPMSGRGCSGASAPPEPSRAPRPM